MKKSQFILKLLSKISGKTNVPTHTAQLKENLKNDYWTLLLNIIVLNKHKISQNLGEFFEFV